MADLAEPRCTVTLRMWRAEGLVSRTTESAGTDRCADLIEDAIRGLSPEELSSLKSDRHPADLFVGLFGGGGSAMFPFSKGVWTSLVAANLYLVFDLYPGQSDPLGGRATELVVEGPPDLLARIRDRCPRLGDGRPVRWNPDAASSESGRAAVRFHFRSVHGQGSAVLDREAIRLLESSGAGLEFVLTGRA